MKKNAKLTAEESAVLASIESGTWRPVHGMQAEIKKYAAYARETTKKTERVSVRMSKQDYLGVQAKAMDEGIPYQTLITSVVHKYLNGSLVAR